MKKKRYAARAGILLCAVALSSCATVLRPPVAGRNAIDPSQSITFAMSGFGGPAADRLWNQAMHACADHDWNAAIDYLSEGAQVAPADKRSLFLQYLEKMAFEPLPLERVCARLAELKVSNAAYYEKLAAVTTASPMSIEWPDEAAVLPWVKTGKAATRFHPIVNVKVNGVSLKLCLDTGAEASVMWSEAAKKVLKPIAGLELETKSSNDKTGQAQTAIADTIELGGLRVVNSRVWLTSLSPGFDSFDGLVGWPILCQMAMTMDARQGTITLSRSAAKRSAVQNFLWLSAPDVLCSTGGDTPIGLIFFLDTGAGSAYFGPGSLQKLKAPTRSTGFGLSGGINGWQIRRRLMVRATSLYLDGKELQYKKYENMPSNPSGILSHDGVLGSDMAQAGIITLDFPSGHIGFDPYPEARK
jgi:hypothetical protein